MITPAQARGARAMLDWRAADLAARAGVAVGTVLRVEAGAGVHSATLAVLRAALEAGGVRFTADGGVVPQDAG